MNKAQLIELVKLLSALESWSFADKHRLPDYLQERLDAIIGVITQEILK